MLHTVIRSIGRVYYYAYQLLLFEKSKEGEVEFLFCNI